jgi:uncharacterized protein (DUF2141 family)
MSRFLRVTLVLVFAASSLPIAAQQQQLASATGTVARVAVPRSKGVGLGTIQGNALDSTNRKMVDARMRLRDARFGQIVGTQLTDKSGIFTFQKLEPGSYIVEMMADDQSILAASDLLNVDGGQVVSAIVKLPFRVPPAAGLAGGTARSTAWIIATQAIASSIAAVVPTRPVSPNQ